MTKEERIIQKKLRRIAQLERNKGKRIKVGYQKIIIEGETWRWNKEKNGIDTDKNKELKN